MLPLSVILPSPTVVFPSKVISPLKLALLALLLIKDPDPEIPPVPVLIEIASLPTAWPFISSTPPELTVVPVRVEPKAVALPILRRAPELIVVAPL
jgi:hypothetical protein